MSHRILVVDPNSTLSTPTEQALVGAGYRVTTVRTFQEARYQLSQDCPDLLISAVRLEAFNGLHLLLRCREDHPNLPVIIVGTWDDFTSDVTRYGARFIADPADPVPFLQLVSDLLAERAPHEPSSKRLWPRKRAQLPAVVLERSARVVEFGYGGLRLEMAELRGENQDPFEIEFPTLGLSVKAVARWSKPREDGGSYWGAEIAAAGSDATRTWRWIVDSLN